MLWRIPVSSGPEPASFDRRRFLRALTKGTAALLVAGPLASACDSTGPAVANRGTTTGADTPTSGGPPPPTPPRGSMIVGGAELRPPAVPLAVHDPYVSVWLCGTELAGSWPTAWTGAPVGICGLIRIDGRGYVWCGDAGESGSGATSMLETSVEVTPTRSIFTMEAAGVRLVVEWLSPIEPGNPRLQSIPLALITATVSATDGHTHAVEIYCDVTGEMASWTQSDSISWSTSTTACRHWAIQLAAQQPFVEHSEMAAWGTAVFSTEQRAAVSYESGASTTVRRGFATSGTLANSSDGNFRAIDNNTPVFALAHHLSVVGAVAVSVSWSLGHFASPAVQYLGQSLDPLWTKYWGSWEEVVDGFLASASETRTRAADLDAEVTTRATQVGGDGYAALCALALRQAYGACQLVVGLGGEPWAFLKEISSDDDISTADVIFDSCAVWLDLDPGYIPMLLEPLLYYAASAEWTENYAPHSLGHWPLAAGNPTGASSEPMPIGDTGALVVMSAVYSARVPAATARPFLSRYEQLWDRWAELLASQLPSPPPQLTTIDYLRSQTGNNNLAVLGLVGLAATGQLAEHLGDTDKAGSRLAQAKVLAGEWAKLAVDPSGEHVVTNKGGTDTWPDLYNAFWDSALGTDLVPVSLTAKQAAWYLSHMDIFGIPVESQTPTLARVDQQLATAAWLYGYPVGPKLVDAVFKYVGNTELLAPMPDTYDPVTGSLRAQFNWRARPVVGAVFSLLLTGSPSG
jgi:hypothetical protein